MAQFPYLLETGFEAGATGFDTAITDTVSKSLGYLHYTQSVPRYGVEPYRGAYLWGIDLSIGTKTAGCYQTQAAFNVAADKQWSFAFAFYMKTPVTMATTNRFTIAACMNSSTEEVVVDVLYTTAGGYQIVLDETSTGTPAVYTTLELNKWHWIEVYGHVDHDGDDNGTAYLVLDGNTVGSLSSLDQGAFTDLYIGFVNGDAGTTKGMLFFDDCIATGIDNEGTIVRVGYRSRTPMVPHVSASQHLFVGPGVVRRAKLLTNTAADKLILYDTDCANTTGSYPNVVAELQVTATQALDTSVDGFLTFERGCYAVISGTNPRAQVYLDFFEEHPRGFPSLVCYLSPANLRSYAMSERKRLPGDSV